MAAVSKFSRASSNRFESRSFSARLKAALAVLRSFFETSQAGAPGTLLAQSVARFVTGGVSARADRHTSAVINAAAR